MESCKGRLEAGTLSDILLLCDQANYILSRECQLIERLSMTLTADGKRQR